MSQRLRNLLSIALVTGLLFHFLLVVLSQQSTPSRSGILSQAYTEPFFHQNWKLFVPPPNYNDHVYVRVSENGHWGSWHDQLQEITSAHRTNRFGGHEQALLAISNSIYYLAMDLPDSTSCYNTSPNFLSFQVFQRALRPFVQNKPYEIILAREKSGQTRIYYFKHLP